MQKNIAFKQFKEDRSNICLRRQLNFLQDRLIDLIEVSKLNYLGTMTNKLINAGGSSKAYWSLL